MPDIMMCANKECPERKQCYRYMAIPSEYRQAYAALQPDESGRCESFLDADGRRVRTDVE